MYKTEEIENPIIPKELVEQLETETYNFPSREEWVEVMKEVRKSSLRQAYKFAKIMLKAGAEVYGITDKAKEKALKQLIKKEFTFEFFQNRVLCEEIPNILDEIESGRNLYRIVPDIFNSIENYVDKRLSEMII